MCENVVWGWGNVTSGKGSWSRRRATASCFRVTSGYRSAHRSGSCDAMLGMGTGLDLWMLTRSLFTDTYETFIDMHSG